MYVAGLIFSVVAAAWRGRYSVRSYGGGVAGRRSGFRGSSKLRKIPLHAEPRALVWRPHDPHLAAGIVISVDPGLPRKQMTCRSAVFVGRDTVLRQHKPSLELYHM